MESSAAIGSHAAMTALRLRRAFLGTVLGVCLVPFCSSVAGAAAPAPDPAPAATPDPYPGTAPPARVPGPTTAPRQAPAPRLSGGATAPTQPPAVSQPRPATSRPATTHPAAARPLTTHPATTHQATTRSATPRAARRRPARRRTDGSVVASPTARLSPKPHTRRREALAPDSTPLPPGFTQVAAEELDRGRLALAGGALALVALGGTVVLGAARRTLYRRESGAQA